MIRVIAIDPGVMSGIAYAKIDEESKILEFFPFQMTDDVDDMFRRLQSFAPRFVVCEDFEFRNRAPAGLNLFPVQLIGVIRFYELSAISNCHVFLQKASYGKSYYTDKILKDKGLYKRGVPHGMDATRHLLQWATFGAGFQYISGGSDPFVMLSEWSDKNE